MINAIIEFSAKNKIIVFILIGAAVMAGLWSMKNVPLDALPDLSDTQVIVYSRWDRSPDIMEDQVTYPIVTAMLGASGPNSVLTPCGSRGNTEERYSSVRERAQ
jgi:Cu(I)/Ag(I) efflux system membrane protein CusA/SilA